MKLGVSWQNFELFCRRTQTVGWMQNIGICCNGFAEGKDEMVVYGIGEGLGRDFIGCFEMSKFWGGFTGEEDC